MDTPYRIERVVVRTDNGLSRSVQYAIVRSGEEELCHGRDAAFMYRLVDLLNEDAHAPEGR